MRFKNVFFDRDGTLTYNEPGLVAWRDKSIENWSGKPFSLTYDKMMALFEAASLGIKPWYRTVEDEREFTKRYYRLLLEGEGVSEDVDNRSLLLFSRLWCAGERRLYPEVAGVLDWFFSRGFKMGVISDTSPSLEYTLVQLGVAGYFGSFTASSLVGASKPAQAIYKAALESLGADASESLYVDDYDIEADGARELGFTSFYLDRSGTKSGRWVIHDLKELRDFAAQM